MSIEMPPTEVYALADQLRGSAGAAAEIAHGLADPGDVGSPLRAAVDTFLDSHRIVGRALAEELQWLGDTVAAVADAWVELDSALLGAPGGGTHGRAQVR